MLTKRIIPCLDVQNGRTVKGVNFINIRDAGDPIELAAAYSEQGADELVLLDITATNEKRKTVTELARKVAERINIPFTIGGGIGSVDDAKSVLNAGADKVAVNSAAVKNPKLVEEIAAKLGNQCLVVAIDGKQTNKGWQVHTHGGKQPTDIDLFQWAKEMENRGAGEILFTSMDNDGTKNGFANQALAQMSALINIPIIASGGAGTKEHFYDAFAKGKADAALAASVFHFREIEIIELKNYLKNMNIPIRVQ